MPLEPVVKENKKIRQILRKKIGAFYGMSFVTDLEDYYLPSLVFDFYDKNLPNFYKYLEVVDLNKEEFSIVNLRIKRFLEELSFLRSKIDSKKVKILGDIHPKYSTKYLSEGKIRYKDYPDYGAILDFVVSELLQEIDYLPEIEKNLEGNISRSFVDIRKETDKESDIKEYYFNLGKFVSVLLYLKAIDINAENMIINLPHPVFFDMETMFSGEFEDNFEEYGIKNTGVIKVEDSNDTSLLTGGISPRKSLLKPMITGTYSKPKIVWRTNSRIGYDNIPLLNGKPVDPGKYMREFFKGYEFSAKIILSRKDELLEKISNKSAVVRVILRPTRIYRHAILKSCYPQIYRKQDLKEFLQKTLGEYNLIYKIEEKNLLEMEVENLFSLVVPVFYSNIHSKEIICPNGEVVGEFKVSLFESWKKYVQEVLSEEYFNSQRSLIEDSLE